MRIQLTKIAHARSGDKGDTANVGLIALCDQFYPLLVREVTSARVKEHFKGICKGDIERFELPNLGALNFFIARESWRRRNAFPDDRCPRKNIFDCAVTNED